MSENNGLNLSNNGMLWPIVILIMLGTLQGALSIGSWGGTPMEDLLETQIDPRPPTSFPFWKNLVVRQRNFDQLDYIDLDTHKKVSTRINNWETYTLRYWYEYRIRNASCPQLPIGIAAATDYSLMCTCLFGNINQPARTIFVHTYMLSHFYESTLKFMPEDVRFILYTGGTDMTIPTGSGDLRMGYPRWFGKHGQGWESMIRDNRIVHWYAENHDMPHEKVTTLPTAFTEDVYYDPLPAGVSYPDQEHWKPLEERPLVILSASRVRQGPQWKAREDMEKLCKSVKWCVEPHDGMFARKAEKMGDAIGVPHAEYVGQLRAVPFIACVHGGGIDPSPKAFEAIFQGTIPIVRKTLLYDSYHLFPIAWVDEWADLFALSDAERNAQFKKWIKELGPYYEIGSALRHKTLERMQTAYWIEDGHKRLAKRLQEERRGLNSSTIESEQGADGHSKHHSGNVEIEENKNKNKNKNKKDKRGMHREREKKMLRHS